MLAARRAFGPFDIRERLGGTGDGSLCVPLEEVRPQSSAQHCTEPRTSSQCVARATVPSRDGPRHWCEARDDCTRSPSQNPNCFVACSDLTVSVALPDRVQLLVTRVKAGQQIAASAGPEGSSGRLDHFQSIHAGTSLFQPDCYEYSPRMLRS